MQRTLRLTAVLTLCATNLFAAPKIVTDIAPIAALVEMVAGDAATVHPLIDPRFDGHSYALRPSDVRAVTAADAIIWLGHGYAPQLEKPFETHAAKTPILDLSAVSGITQLPTRAAMIFGHDEAHEDHDHDAHGHDTHDDHGHDDHQDHAQEHEHADHKDEHDGHNHGPIDPHLWLDPDSARKWLPQIVTLLVKIDPENAQLYKSQAQLADDSIAKTDAHIQKKLKNIAPIRFILGHDSTQYFETHFGLQAVSSLTTSDGRPIPPRLLSKALDTKGDEQQIDCALSDPRHPNPLLTQVAKDGLNVVPIDVVSPDKQTSYVDLLLSISGAFEHCKTGN